MRLCYLLSEDGDGFAVDNELATLNLDFTVETAMGGVILEHVSLSNRGLQMFLFIY